MPHISSADGMESQWTAFKKCLCEPYQNNPRLLGSTTLWFDELYARREPDGLELSSYQIENTDTGRTFNTFCLNNQIYFSHDEAVLTLPHPRNMDIPNDRSDRLVGIWLHDIGVMDESLQSAYRDGIEKVNSSGKPFIITDQNEVVFGEIQRRLRSPSLPVGAADQFSALGQIRTSKSQPLADKPHRDINFTQPDNTRGPTEGPLEPAWNRFIIHVVHGAGTTFLIGEKENIRISTPTGATSSHFAANIKKSDGNKAFGALHEATGNSDGRAILTPKYVVQEPIPEVPSSHWRFNMPPAAAPN